MQYTIVGGGVAACFAVKAIEKYDPDARITVVSEEEHCFYYRPMTPLIIKGDKERDEILYEEHLPEFHVIHDRAVALNTAAREITLSNGDALSFDRLLIAQAQHEQLVLVTEDAAFGPYDVELRAP